jgi:hypothetical protein
VTLAKGLCSIHSSTTAAGHGLSGTWRRLISSTKTPRTCRRPGRR